MADSDFVFAMDQSNLEDLVKICPAEHAHKLALLLSVLPGGGGDVPDPYYGGKNGFERVLDLVEAASSGLLEHVREQHELAKR